MPVLVLCGCRVLLDPDEYDGIGSAERDGGNGGLIDGGLPPGGVFSGEAITITCDDSEPLHFAWSQLGNSLGTAALRSGTYVIDTDNGKLTGPGIDQPVDLPRVLQRNNREAFALVVNSLQTQADTVIRAKGEHPLIIAGNLLILAGTIDASSYFDELASGAGSGLGDSCDAESGNIGQPEPGSGGGGGGFGSGGGKGGDGNAAGGQGGSAAFSDVFTGARGGCPGRAGGVAIPSNSNRGGLGGGAIQLTACAQLRLVGGGLLAGGAGGEGGSATGSHGGAGGGAGGYIGMEALTIDFTAGPSSATPPRVVANGGAGAGGSVSGSAGDLGEDGTARDNGAMGGPAGGSSGNGGNGGARGSEAGSEGMPGAGDGAGGGGGAVGVILLRSVIEDGSADFSPAPLRCPPPPTPCNMSSFGDSGGAPVRGTSLDQ